MGGDSDSCIKANLIEGEEQKGTQPDAGDQGSHRLGMHAPTSPCPPVSIPTQVPMNLTKTQSLLETLVHVCEEFLQNDP